MTIFQRETKRFAKAVSEWQSADRLWCHVRAPEGTGAAEFVRASLRKHLADAVVVVDLDFRSFPLEADSQLQAILRSALLQDAIRFESFLSSYPRRVQRLIQAYLQSDPGRESPSAGEPWEFQLFGRFLTSLSGAATPVLLLENLFDCQGSAFHALLSLLKRLKRHRLLVVSSGERDFPPEINQQPQLELQIDKLSVREAERYIRSYLPMDPVNARIITNHLYIKSGGNPRSIVYLLEAYYHQLLEPDPQQLMDSTILQRLRISAVPEEVYERLLGAIPDRVLDLMVLLARIDEPFPTRLFLKVVREQEYGKRDYDSWIRKQWLKERSYLGEPHVSLSSHNWKAFLRRRIPIARVEPLLQFLKLRLQRYRFTLPVSLSRLFFDTGDIMTSLKLALNEARLFRTQRKLQRAAEIYAFLKRNVLQYPKSGISMNLVLQELSEIQREIGLHENAYESLRELRDRYTRNEEARWIQTGLEMADTLYSMDALTEARYLLIELKSKEMISTPARLHAEILLGELEQNSGNGKYARRHFEGALALLSEAAHEKLALRLYRLLKQIYLSADAGRVQHQLIQTVRDSLSEESAARSYLDLEEVKLLVQQRDYRAALPNCIKMFREGRALLIPAIALQVRLYLAEIYGYLGKWYLARSHLKELLSTRILLSDSRISVQVMMNLGVVEREVCHYHAALEVLEEALEICQKRGYQRESYQIHLHIGHIFLLVSSFIRARKHLSGAMEWAEENQDHELVIQSDLLMSSYELAQSRPANASTYLRKARTAVQNFGNEIDRLNYFYYLTVFQVQSGEHEKAAESLAQWESDARGIIKFENLFKLLSGRVLHAAGENKRAAALLEEVTSLGRRYRLPYLEFQAKRALALASREDADGKAFDKHLQDAQAAFEQMKAAVGDEILARQIQESQEYEELLRLMGNR